MTLYTASRTIPLLAQRALWLLVRTTSPRVIPGATEIWEPPLPIDDLAELQSQWRAIAGVPIAALAVYNRPQEHRRSIALLACAGQQSLMIRVRREAESLDMECRISERAHAFGIRAFRVPRVRGAGSLNGWHWVAYEAMARRPHAPDRRADRAVFADATALVEAVIPRPAATPPDWQGAHGDLTPWNLRRVGFRRWLIDWEDARFAPPGSDEVYFALTAATLPRRRPRAVPTVLLDYPEACRYWAAELAARQVADRDAAAINRMRSLLHKAAERASCE